MAIDYTPGDAYAEAICNRFPNALQVQYNDWEDFLFSYRRDDRGRKTLGVVEISPNGEITADGMFGNILFNNRGFIQLAGEYGDVPVARSDIGCYKNLQKIAINPILKLLAEELPKKERDGGEILMPNEYAQVVNNLSRVYHFQSFQLGRSLLAHEGGLTNLKAAISPYEAVSKTFYVGWKGKFHCRPGITGKKDFSVIVYYVADSYSGKKILLDAMEVEDPRILQNKNPDDGIERVILGNSWSRRAFSSKIQEILHRRQLNRLSQTSLLRQRADPTKFGNYLVELYPENVRTERPETTYIS
jgi:hypothetical protein